MKNKLTIILVATISSLLFGFLTFAETIPQIQQWSPVGGFLIPKVSKVGTSTSVYYGSGANLTGITATGISSLNGSTSSTQTFATSSDTNVGLTIGTANGIHTFTPTWIGTLADDRIASAGTWNGKIGSSTPFTAGYVPYATGTPVGLTNSVIFQSGTNIGINITTPSSTLSVGGQGITNAGIYGTGSLFGVYGQSAISGTYGIGGSYGVFGSSTASAGVGVRGTAINNIGVYGDASGVGAAGVYGTAPNGYDFYANSAAGKSYFAGSVGIGTTTPQYKLDVQGTGRFTGALTLDTPLTDANIGSAATWNAKITTSSLSSTATGLTFNNVTGVFSWTDGYEGLRTASSTNWNTAFSQTRQWDGGATGLVAATGRTSLGLGSLATANSVGIASTTGIQATISFPLAVASTSLTTGTNLVLSTNTLSVSSTPSFTEVHIPSLTNTFLATDNTGKIIATTTASGVSSVASSSDIAVSGATGSGITFTLQTPTSTYLTKPTNKKHIQWSAAYTTSTNTWFDPIFSFDTTSTIREVWVNSSSSGNTFTFNLYYYPTNVSKASMYKVFSSDQTATSTAGPVKLTTFASSTPQLGSGLWLDQSKASTTLTTLTIYYTDD